MLIGGQPPPPAPEYPPGLSGPVLVEADLTAERLRGFASQAPATRLDGLLTRAVDRRRAGDAIAALVVRDATWIVVMSVGELKLDALASSYSGTGDVLLIGQNLELVADAYHRMVRLGSGIVTPRQTLPLPAGCENPVSGL